MAKAKLFFIFLILSFAVLGCEYIPGLAPKAKPKPKAEVVNVTMPPSGTVVARVGNFYIGSGDLQKEIDGYNAMVEQQGVPQNKIDSRDKKLAYLRNEMVRKYILYQEALDRGLDKRDDIARALENAKMGLLVSELLREEIEKIEVSSKEVEDFYEQNKEALREPEQRKILEIMVPQEADAKQIYIELLKGADFSTIAKQLSKAKTASAGGDLGLLSLEPDPQKRVRFDKFYEVAFSPSLEVGSISSIFKGPDGYYIVKLESVKKSETKSLSELWDNIKSWLLFEKQQKALADLANKLSGQTKVEVYDGKVE